MAAWACAGRAVRRPCRPAACTPRRGRPTRPHTPPGGWSRRGPCGAVHAGAWVSVGLRARVSVGLCTCVWGSLCLPACVSVGLYTCAYTGVCGALCVCVHACLCVHACPWVSVCLCARVSMGLHACMRIHMWAAVCRHARMCTALVVREERWLAGPEVHQHGWLTLPSGDLRWPLRPCLWARWDAPWCRPLPREGRRLAARVPQGPGTLRDASRRGRPRAGLRGSGVHCRSVCFPERWVSIFQPSPSRCRRERQPSGEQDERVGKGVSAEPRPSSALPAETDSPAGLHGFPLRPEVPGRGCPRPGRGDPALQRRAQQCRLAEPLVSARRRAAGNSLCLRARARQGGGFRNEVTCFEGSSL